MKTTTDDYFIVVFLAPLILQLKRCVLLCSAAWRPLFAFLSLSDSWSSSCVSVCIFMRPSHERPHCALQLVCICPFVCYMSAPEWLSQEWKRRSFRQAQNWGTVRVTIITWAIFPRDSSYLVSKRSKIRLSIASWRIAKEGKIVKHYIHCVSAPKAWLCPIGPDRAAWEASTLPITLWNDNSHPHIPLPRLSPRV